MVRFGFSSGLAATDCLMRSFKAGDEIITMDDLYGGTSYVYSNIQPFRHQVSLCDMNDLDNITAVKTKMIWVKTPTNPLMKLAIYCNATITTQKTYFSR
jgi:cystathionine beta-lyase